MPQQFVPSYMTKVASLKLHPLEPKDCRQKFCFKDEIWDQMSHNRHLNTYATPVEILIRDEVMLLQRGMESKTKKRKNQKLTLLTLPTEARPRKRNSMTQQPLNLQSGSKEHC